MRYRLLIQCFGTQHQFVFSGSPSPEAAKKKLTDSIRFGWEVDKLTANVLSKPLICVIPSHWDKDDAIYWFWHSFQIVKTEVVPDKRNEGKEMFEQLFGKLKYHK